jgi:hypothetical protein
MKYDTFKKKATPILAKQPKEEVDLFFQHMELDLMKDTADLFEGVILRSCIYKLTDENKVKSQLSPDVKKVYEEELAAIEEMIGLLDSGRVSFFDRENALDEAMRIKLILFQDYVLKTGGARTQLDLNEVCALFFMRWRFMCCFSRLTPEYRGDNMLRQLGRELLGHQVPESVGKMFEKMLSLNHW